MLSFNSLETARTSVYWYKLTITVVTEAVNFVFDAGKRKVHISKTLPTRQPSLRALHTEMYEACLLEEGSNSASSEPTALQPNNHEPPTR